MTKEQYNENMQILIKNLLKKIECENNSPLPERLIKTIEEIVFNSYSAYQEETVKIIPSNFNLIWSFFEHSISSIATHACFQSEEVIKEKLKSFNLFHYLATADFFGIE